MRSCHESSLALAVSNGARSIAFPAISCGVYGYPIEDAALIALTATAAFLESHEQIKQVLFVLFGRATLEKFDAARRELSGGAAGPSGR